MTARKHLKELVRARMNKTGESYTAARRQVLRQPAGSPTPAFPFHFPGSIPGPTALRALLAGAGVQDPRSGAPLSEAMTMGLAGGIGAGMFTFRYAKENVSTFFVAGRHLWHDHVAWAKAAVERLGLTAVVRESSGAGPAERQLRELREPGRPVIAWITFRGKMYHLVTVHRLDPATGDAFVGDLGDEPVRVPMAELTKGRGVVKKDKHRLLALEPAKAPVDLERAVRAGIAACADGLVKGRMKNFTLDGFAAWADRLDGSKAADGWEKIFPAGPNLYQGLKSIAEFVEYAGTGGGLCRPMFAEFLAEAADLVGDRRLASIGKRYESLGHEWTALAEAALPRDIPLFRETRDLLARQSEILTVAGDGAADEMSFWVKAIADVNRRTRDGFPLDEPAAATLRRDLKRRVSSLVEGERAAWAELNGWR